MSGFRLVAYLYRCTTCGMEYRAQVDERTVLACNHPLAGQNHTSASDRLKQREQGAA